MNRSSSMQLNAAALFFVFFLQEVVSSINPFATRDNQKKFGNPMRFFGNIKNKVMEAISPQHNKNEEDATTKAALIPTQLRSYRFESSEKVLAAKQRTWQCTNCNTNDPLLIAGGEVGSAERDAVTMEMVVTVDTSSCRVTTLQIPMLTKGFPHDRRSPTISASAAEVNDSVSASGPADDTSLLHPGSGKRNDVDAVDRFMADIGAQRTAGDVCSDAAELPVPEREVQLSSDAESSGSEGTDGVESATRESGPRSTEEALPPVMLITAPMEMLVPQVPTPAHTVGTQGFITTQAMFILHHNVTLPDVCAVSGQGLQPAGLPGTRTNITDATYGTNVPVRARANDLSHIALFCFMLGIICSAAISKLMSYYEHWAKERVPRYIAQLEARVVAMLHNEQHSAVKTLLGRELPTVVSLRSEEHVDTAAFRHFFSKALLALCENVAAEALLHKVVRCYEGYGEDLYMAHALEDLALAQQHQGGARKLGVALGTMRHALRIYCEEAWVVKNAAAQDGKAVQRRLYVETDSEGASSLSTPDSLCLSVHSPLSVRRSSVEATPATSGKRVSPNNPARRRSGTDSSSSHTLMHGYIDSVLNMSADSEGTVMDGLLNTPAKPVPVPGNSTSGSHHPMADSLPQSRSDSPLLSSTASPISYAVSDSSEYFPFPGANEMPLVDSAVPSAEGRDSGSVTTLVAVAAESSGNDATHPFARSIPASAEVSDSEGAVPASPAGLNSAEKCGVSLRQALDELESLLLEPSLTSTALQLHQESHNHHHAASSSRDPLHAARVDGEEEVFGDVFRSYASPDRHPAERGFGQVGAFETPIVKSACAATVAASAAQAVVYPACPHVARVLQRVAGLLRALGRGSEALAFWTAACEVCSQLYGAESAEVCVAQKEVLQELRTLSEQVGCNC